MGIQGLGMAAIHRIERATGLYILRAVVNNGGDWRFWFFTDDQHRHGWIDVTGGGEDTDNGGGTKSWAFDPRMLCLQPMCTYLFGSTLADPRVRDGSWGRWCHGRAGFPGHSPQSRWHAVTPPLLPHWRCPPCHAERTDYEGEPGMYLPTCPNCGSTVPPEPIPQEVARRG